MKKIFHHDLFKSPLGYWCLIVIAVFPFVASDIYMPVLPEIALDFSGDSVTTRLIASYFLCGLAVSQLVYGPLADRYGRLRILLTGSIIALLGLALITSSENLPTMIWGRMIQGIGVGAALIVSRSMFRDLYHGAQLVQTIAYLGVIIALSNVLTPLVSAYIQHWFGWPAIVYVLWLGGAVCLLAALRILPETCVQGRHQHINLTSIWEHYRSTLVHPVFITNVCMTTMAMSCMVTIFILVPFLFQNLLAVSVVGCGWWLSSFTGMMLIGKLCNAVLVKHYAMQQLLQTGLLIMMIAGCMLVFVVALGWISPGWVACPMGCLCYGMGLVFSNAFASTMDHFPHKAGYAGALYGFIQLLGTYLASWVAAHLSIKSMWPMCAVLGGLPLVGYGLFCYRSVPGLSHTT